MEGTDLEPGLQLLELLFRNGVQRRRRRASGRPSKPALLRGLMKRDVGSILERLSVRRSTSRRNGIGRWRACDRGGWSARRGGRTGRSSDVQAGRIAAVCVDAEGCVGPALLFMVVARLDLGDEGRWPRLGERGLVVDGEVDLREI